ncbi:putative Ig domain-containing protein [Bradyrhizobium sp. OK095]|uniref:putative Ig domain-containing protein n=1 Tax=Bradyrhizobium sp. OK095 TaxID=1882760 RepID=UPI001FCCFE47|nr:putative Ig domain-containing protein [Bradyrhizobium sp. OK095]
MTGPTATQAIASQILTQNQPSVNFTPVTGSGGTAPLTYGISPTLPSGLSFNTSTGAITGIPTVASAVATYTVTITDAASATATNTFSLTVNSAVTAAQSVASKTLTQNQASTNFTPVTGGGGTGALTYGISPSLPTGLSFNTSTGAITGIPTATSGTQTYTVTITDTKSASASNTFSLTVSSAVTATQSVAAVTLTQNNAMTPVTPVTGGGGTSPLSYSPSPALPTGLTLNASTGQITGTPTVTHAASSFTITVTDANSATASNTFTLTVNSAVTATQAIASVALTANHAASPFTPVTGAGGTGSLSYGVSPTLPAGLSFNTANGQVTGTPTGASATTTYTVTVTDNLGASASNTFSLTVNGPVTATQAVATVTLTQNHAVTPVTPVTGAGGTSPLAYSVSPSLPTGLAFSSSTGQITGTPTVTSGAATYTVTVTDANSTTASNTFALAVNSAVTATQAVAAVTLTAGHAANAFTPVTGGGGTSPLSYAVSPSLPAGLSLNTSTGAVTGTPTAASAAATYTVTVSDANSATASNTFSLTVNGAVTATQAIPSKSLTVNIAAASFTPVTGSGGTTPLSYGVSPTLPAGLAMNSSTGTISGTPTATSAVTTYTVTVTDANSATATNTFSLAVNGAVTATQSIASKTLTQNSAATPFTPVTGSGGTSPLTYAIAPGLPAGLTLNTSTGAISGTPTTTLGATTFTVTVTDANAATAGSTFSLTVNGAVTATQAVPSTVITANHAAPTFTPVTGGGGTAPLSFSVSPALPAGLTYSTSNGSISGTPTATIGATTFTVTVTDANNATATNTFSLTVNGAVVATTAIPSTALPINQVVTPFTPVTGSGGTGALTYAISPALPAGLAYNTATGSISGTPTTPLPTTTFTVTITDTNSASASSTFNLSVGQVATTIGLTSSANPSQFGQPVTFSATVTGAGGTPAGNVTFNDGGSAIGTGTLSGGVATFTTSTLAIGSHTITASYSGSALFAPSTSAALAQSVNVPADSLKLRALQANVTKVVAQNSGQAISGAIDDAISDGFNTDGGTLITPGNARMRINFSADPRNDDDAAADAGNAGRNSYDANRNANGMGRARRNGSRVDDAFAAIDQQMPKKAVPKWQQEKEWLLWADVRGSGIDRWNSSSSFGVGQVNQASLRGQQVNALMGLTYRARPNLLVGVLGGYENFSYTDDTVNGKLKGDGWTVGAYLGWKIISTLRYDAALTYSGIGYDGTAGTAQGNFNGNRWMFATGFTGTYKWAGLYLEPSAKVYALWERENAYVDSLGTQQATRTFSTGRASAGNKVAYPVAWIDSVLLAPYLGVYADYYFTQDDAAAIVAAGGIPLASTPLLQGWSARVTGGIGAKLASGVTVGFGAELGGIGGNTQIWTFTGRARVPF